MKAEQQTNRIFMTPIKTGHDKRRITLAVFLKGKKEHSKELQGFLKNQQIDCTEIPAGQRDQLPELAYFDEGFFLSVAPERWSFYELRSYVQRYADTCSDTFVLRDRMHHAGVAAEERLVFDDGFYLRLAEEIYRCKDIYYQENMSISLFLSAILKLLRQNLELYWAAVTLLDIQTHKTTYLNYEPPTLSRKEVLRATTSRPETVVYTGVHYSQEHLADIFIQPGPFSPDTAVMQTFLSQLCRHINGFIYGHLAHRRELFLLRSEIAELSKQHQPAPCFPPTPEREQKTRKKLQLLLIGDALLNNGQIFSEFTNQGFDVRNIELQTDHDKYHTFDTNNLLAVRSRYDGILLGPMPHRMKGTFMQADNLIDQMQATPENYPPFVLIRDKRGDIKITKSSLRGAIKELLAQIEQVEKYEPPTTLYTERNKQP